MKIQLALLGVVIAGAAAFYWFYQPDSREAYVPPAPVAVAPEPAPEIPPPPPAPTVAPDAQAPVAAPIADAHVADAAPAGPYTVDLREHTIHLRDKPWVLHVHLQLVTSAHITYEELRRSRRNLVRMLFFLGSHRTKEGSEGADGQARFEADLLARFRNVIKTGPIDELKVLRYEIAEFVPPDGGQPPSVPPKPQ